MVCDRFSEYAAWRYSRRLLLLATLQLLGCPADFFVEGGLVLAGPEPGSAVTKPTVLTFRVTPHRLVDAQGVCHVEFYDNGELACSDATSPYACEWQPHSRPADPG